MKNLPPVVSAFVLGCLGLFALGGCAAGAASEDDASANEANEANEETGTSEAALKAGGGGGGMNFSCGPLGCICNGDYDCNNMFGSGVCDNLPGRCFERGPAQYCICGGPFVPGRAAVGGSAVSGTGGAAVASR